MMKSEASVDDRNGFEPEVEFPSNPFDAARVFLGILAYPERGAGKPDRPGAVFAEAMWSRVIWSFRKARGLRAIRNELSDLSFKPPELREFEAIYFRGRRRLRRRSAAYSLYGTQLLNGFFAVREAASNLSAEGRMSEAFAGESDAAFRPIRPELWGRCMPSPSRVISSNLDGWAKRLSLNKTGRAADARQKVKDLAKRAYVQSRPVLHLAHAFDWACDEIGPTLPGWDESEGDFLLTMLVNAEKWIFPAIDEAVRWREALDGRPIGHVTSDDLVKLWTSKPAE